MNVIRETDSFSISDLSKMFQIMDFPEYQREPNVWTLAQKRQLVDSILRGFDISSIYIYERDDGVWECIDGRQRLNAIMSFLGLNAAYPEHNGFSIAIDNEVGEETDSLLMSTSGHSMSELQELAEDNDDVRRVVDEFLDYKITTVVLRDLRGPNEFNLQFLRLNLGTLINAGEKLNAMVGDLHDLIFKPDGLGHDPFLRRAKVPTRRFAIEQIAAQILLQMYSKTETGEFTRARHVDLQRFFREQFDLEPRVRTASDELRTTLDALDSVGSDWDGLLKSRAITVSLVILAWSLGVGRDGPDPKDIHRFSSRFLSALAEKATEMRELRSDVRDRRSYLIDFQRNVTQAAVEKPAITQRHEVLMREYDNFVKSGDISD